VEYKQGDRVVCIKKYTIFEVGDICTLLRRISWNDGWLCEKNKGYIKDEHLDVHWRKITDYTRKPFKECEITFELHSDENHSIPVPFEIHSTKHRRNTTVKWADGTNTTVKANKDDKFSVYAGFTSALMKKVYGHTNPNKFCIITHKKNEKKEKGDE